MPLEVEDGERADVADAVDVDGELAEEVDDGRCTCRQGEPEDKWREDDRQRLLDEHRDLHREKLSEIVVYLDMTGARVSFEREGSEER